MPALQELARVVAAGDPGTALARLLRLVCEQLAMDVAYVSAVDRAGVLQERAVERDGGAGRAEALLVPGDAAWKQLVLADGLLMVADVRARLDLLCLTSTSLCEIGSYAGVPLLDEDGVAFGLLGVYGHGTHASLNSRDHDVLTGLAEVVAELLGADPAAPTPLSALESVARAVEAAGDVEELTRPLLEALADLTGLASTYLTVVHEAAGVQEIRYARNLRPGFEIPEGLVVPWEDTLCKRALEEDRPCTTDVPSVWGDSDAARDLGIQVYVSVPVELPDGRLLGTLCAADSVRTEDAAAQLPTMRLFARLIGAQAEREEALRRAREEADRDPLTGCASRRVVGPWLSRELASQAPEESVVVAYADLNAFKAVNDTYGHAAGDAVLAEVGRRLGLVARPHDLVARIGGDEFLVAARLPRDVAAQLGERVRSVLTFSLPWEDTSIDVTAAVGIALSDDHDAASIVGMADAAMYAAKRAGALGRS